MYFCVRNHILLISTPPTVSVYCCIVLSLFMVQNLLYVDLVDIIRRSCKHYQQLWLKKDLQGHFIMFVKHLPSSLVFQWHRFMIVGYGSLFLCYIWMQWYYNLALMLRCSLCLWIIYHWEKILIKKAVFECMTCVYHKIFIYCYCQHSSSLKGIQMNVYMKVIKIIPAPSGPFSDSQPLGTCHEGRTHGAVWTSRCWESVCT
jgi:hypothetical protein